MKRLVSRGERRRAPGCRRRAGEKSACARRVRKRSVCRRLARGIGERGEAPWQCMSARKWRVVAANQCIGLNRCQPAWPQAKACLPDRPPAAGQSSYYLEAASASRRSRCRIASEIKQHQECMSSARSAKRKQAPPAGPSCSHRREAMKIGVCGSEVVAPSIESRRRCASKIIKEMSGESPEA